MSIIRTRGLTGLVAGTLVIAVLAGCGDTAGSLDATDAWARNSPAIATAGAAYLRISNGTDADDALVAVNVDPSVAATAELHETVAAMPSDGGMGMSPSGGPMMEMREVDRIAVPAGESVALEPGGYHVMLIDLAEPLELGSTIELTLEFEEAGTLVVTAEVRESAP